MPQRRQRTHCLQTCYKRNAKHSSLNKREMALEWILKYHEWKCTEMVNNLDKYKPFYQCQEQKGGYHYRPSIKTVDLSVPKSNVSNEMTNSLKASSCPNTSKKKYVICMTIYFWNELSLKPYKESS